MEKTYRVIEKTVLTEEQKKALAIVGQLAKELRIQGTKQKNEINERLVFSYEDYKILRDTLDSTLLLDYYDAISFKY